jgi:hypothetical protein
VRNAKSNAELDENERRADYEAILKQDPQHVEALSQLGQLVQNGTNMARAAPKPP